MKKMKALVAADGKVACGERELPSLAPGEIRLAVLHCGICGSDLHWYRHGYVPAICPGHEIVGEVTESLPGVAGFRAGERVTVEAVRGCGTCSFCQSGSRQLCTQLGLVGVDRPGGFAEYLDVLPSQLHLVPESVSSEVATFAEPVAVAVHALRMGPSPVGKNALVLGGGTIGLLTALCLVRAGASRVDITAKRPHQRAAAEQLGSTSIIVPGESTANTYDLVYETVGGDGGTITEALNAVRPGGTVVVLGVFATPPPLPALQLMCKEVRMVGAMCYGSTAGVADFQTAHEILKDAGEAIAACLLTHSYPLEAVGEAFATALDKESGSIKVQVKI